MAGERPISPFVHMYLCKEFTHPLSGFSCLTPGTWYYFTAKENKGPYMFSFTNYSNSSLHSTTILLVGSIQLCGFNTETRFNCHRSCVRRGTQMHCSRDRLLKIPVLHFSWGKKHALIQGATLRTSPLSCQVWVGESIFLGTHICSVRWQHTMWLLSILICTAQESFLCLPSLLAKSKLQDYFHYLSPLDTLNRWLPITALHVYSSKLFNLFCVGQINFYSNSAATPSTAYMLAGTDEFCHATSFLFFFSICTDLLLR